jgi:gluconolactonase
MTRGEAILAPPHCVGVVGLAGMISASVICSNIDHAECVAWSPAGRLVFGTEAGDIHELSIANGSRRHVATLPGFVLGVAVDGDDNVYACIWDSRSILKCSATDGGLTVISSGPDDAPFRTPNFLAFHPDGSLYVSDSGSAWETRDGRIIRIDPTGRAAVASTAVPGFPNGVAVDERGAHLYVLESSEPRLTRLPIRPDGLLGPPQLVAELPGTVPDGLALAADGNYVVACFKPDSVLLIRDGAVETLISDWRGLLLNSPTNACFFGPDLDRLAATNLAGRTIVEITEHNLVGLPLHYPAPSAVSRW